MSNVLSVIRLVQFGTPPLMRSTKRQCQTRDPSSLVQSKQGSGRLRCGVWSRCGSLVLGSRDEPNLISASLGAGPPVSAQRSAAAAAGGGASGAVQSSMRPSDEFNGDGAAARSDDSEGEDAGLEEELSLLDAAAPARALAALNALRKSRQHYDVLLLAAGAELPAHRAVLAAASPYLLEALAAPGPQPPAYRVDDVDADALRELVEYAYTGRLRVREPGAARRLYRAAWRLRVEPVRLHLAERLLRRLAPHDCLETRALPDLAPHQLRQLDEYIAASFDELCESGALAALPLLRIEMLRESSAEGGEETPGAVADAALTWLRDRHTADVDLDELCSRIHLLFVDSRGELRDCGELPESRGDAPELLEYRREAAERERGVRRREAAPRAPLPLALGARNGRGAADCAVLASRGLGAGAGGVRTTRALIALRGRLAVARVAWRDVGGGEGASVGRGGVLGGHAPEPADAERRARLAVPRCAHGAAALGGRLLVCGGYDRARVLRDAEAYDPATNAWSPLPAMRSARARFPTASLGGAIYVLGGSDGHAELDSVDAFEAAGEGGAWRARAKLPLARSYAAAAVDEERGELYVIGGWAGGLSLKRVHKYSPRLDAWSEAPPLGTGRSQCAGVAWRGALWVLGGHDAWRCLASTETLAWGAEAWAAGAALPTARRSMGGAVWRGRLVAAGGSDGAASLRRTEWLLAPERGWAGGPPLRRARAALGLAVLGDALFAAGGFDGKEFLSCVECLYAPDGEWTTLCAPVTPPAPMTPMTPEAVNGAAEHDS